MTLSKKSSTKECKKCMSFVNGEFKFFIDPFDDNSSAYWYDFKCKCGHKWQISDEKI